MEASGGSRIEWHDIPAAVRGVVEAALGARVVAARNQPGGFSPGLAARCALADGRQVFLKAVSPDQNPQACRMHRREAEISALLPAHLPAPRLLHVHDDGHWVVLAFEEVPGRQPTEPWTLDDLDRVVPALARFAELVTPSPVAGLQTVAQRHAPVFDGWRRLAAGDGDASTYGDAVIAVTERLAELEATWEAAAAGDALLHADLRADNLLLTPDGEVVLVDWPWGCTGAAFVDLAFMLPSVGLGAGPDPATVIDRYGLFDDVDPDAVRAVVSAIAGFFVRQSVQPPPPGLPNLRAFQRAQAEVALGWLLPLVD